MRALLIVGFSLLCWASVAAAQPVFELAPVFRIDKVYIEAGAGGATPVVGAVAALQLGKHYRVEGEITQASHGFDRSYEGRFISYAGPNATREEIERLAPTARRTLVYDPGIGYTGAFVISGVVHPRVTAGGRLGFSVRRYEESSSYTILTIPPGIESTRVANDLRDEYRERTRGGLLMGLDVSIAVTNHFSVAPDVRFVYGGPARVGNKYRELGAGVRASWRF